MDAARVQYCSTQSQRRPRWGWHRSGHISSDITRSWSVAIVFGFFGVLVFFVCSWSLSFLGACLSSSSSSPPSPPSSPSSPSSPLLLLLLLPLPLFLLLLLLFLHLPLLLPLLLPSSSLILINNLLL
eukprot:TRINITY_DN155_c1_g2_i1.p3 TRINITY_DN155_c1_g2~~TRINITY_DN155_c1_g2_i1.p3  ORF type:complete len:127 (+),score=40.20 TRINITY_DN155_c1_g2_i1:291-671(+)